MNKLMLKAIQEIAITSVEYYDSKQLVLSAKLPDQATHEPHQPSPKSDALTVAAHSGASHANGQPDS